MEEDVNTQESVIPEDENVDSSTTEAQETQESESQSPEQGVTQEQEEQGMQHVPYDRFKEINDEKNWYKNQLEQSLNRPQPVQQAQQPTASTIDSYIANAQDAETKLYWQNMKQIVVESANQIADTKVKATEERMKHLETAYMQRESQRMLKEFRKEYPNIKPGSAEEKRVIELMGQHYPIEHAALIAQGERGFKSAEDRGRQQAQNKFKQKQQANVESSPGVPNSSLSKGKSERELIGEALDGTSLMV